LVFDKTGTLTVGQISVASWNWSPTINDSTRELALCLLSSLDQSSSHHVAGAIAAYARHLGGASTDRPTSIHESQGMGVVAEFGGNKLIVGRREFMSENAIKTPTDTMYATVTHVALNDQVIATAAMDDTTRSESLPLIHDLREQGFTIDILSGDSASRTAKMANELTLNKTQAHGDATPASKLLFIRAASAKCPVVMIGNGLNDSGAMAHAEISIAVAGSSSSAMNSADICLLKPDISLIESAIQYAMAARYRTRLVFAFALFYNILGLTLAASGHVTPVVAAILMPVSSITITHVATSWSLKRTKRHPRLTPATMGGN
jgi:P-type E1-E2 ATPase